MPRYEEDDDDDRPRRSRRRRDDDDDDDRDERPRRSQSSGGSGAKIAAIIGGVIVCIFLICGGLFLYIYTSVKKGVNEVQAKMGEQMEKMRVEGEQRRKDEEAKEEKKREAEKNSDYGKAKSAADTLMQNVKGRRIEAIHSEATASFQKRMTVEELKSTIETNGSYLDSARPFEKEWGVEPALTGSTYIFSQQLQTAFGFRNVKVTMIKEGNVWKLDQFVVENRG